MRTINVNQFKSVKQDWELEKEVKQSRKADKSFRSARKNRKAMWEFA